MVYLIKGAFQLVLGVVLSVKSYKFVFMKLISLSAISAIILLFGSNKKNNVLLFEEEHYTLILTTVLQTKWNQMRIIS